MAKAKEMHMTKQDFSVFPKTLKNGTMIFYYTTYDEHNKRRQFSTGKRSKTEAIKFCLERMTKGLLVPTSSLLFSEYAKDFYDYERSTYIKGKLQRGFSYSHSSADSKNRFIRNKAIPFFEGKTMSTIAPKDIEAFIISLKDAGLTNTTTNKALKDLKVIFHEALKRGDITADPTAQIQPFKNDTREKGIFSVAEIERLFCGKDTVETVWEGKRDMYLLNLLAVRTGMRLGELQALQVRDIMADHIIIRHSYDCTYGIKETKTGTERIVPVKEELLGELKSLCGSRNADAFVFSHTDGKTPVRRKDIYKSFRTSLGRIGITEEERKRRNITFHSYRHTFASILANRNAPELYIRTLTGHSSLKMLHHYTHIQPEMLAGFIGE